MATGLNRMIGNHLRHNGMKKSIYSPLEQYGERLGQNILSVPMLLE